MAHWSIPRTFYPIALTSSLVWMLFLLACAAAIIGIAVTIKYKGMRIGLLLAVPIAVATLAISMLASMVLTFFCPRSMTDMGYSHGRE